MQKALIGGNDHDGRDRKISVGSQKREDNVVSMNLWKSFGFVPNGEISAGGDACEVVLTLKVK